MPHKKVRKFQKFDMAEYIRKKELRAIAFRDWVCWDTKKKLGTIVETVIFADATDYGDPAITNVFEKLAWKIPKDSMDIPVNSVVVPVNPTGVLYGEFQNQISAKADDLKIVSAPKGA